MNKNKSIWEFLDSQATEEVKKYIDTHKDYIKSKQKDIDSLACYFCRKNKERLFLYLIEQKACDFPTIRKGDCDPYNCNFLCNTFEVEGMTAKEIEEDKEFQEGIKNLIEEVFIKEIKQIIEEHKDELDKLS